VHRALKALLQQKEAIMDTYLVGQLLTSPAVDAKLHVAHKQALAAEKLAADAAAAAAAAAARANGGGGGGGSSGGSVRAAVGGNRPLPKAGPAGKTAAGSGGVCYSMWDLYEGYWLPFGELLTAMESEGVRVDRCGACCCCRCRGGSICALAAYSLRLTLLAHTPCGAWLPSGRCC
jgi:hypothetical protein